MNDTIECLVFDPNNPSKPEDASGWRLQEINVPLEISEVLDRALTSGYGESVALDMATNGLTPEQLTKMAGGAELSIGFFRAGLLK